jgi:mono/diheme cytochrome c family protein
MSRRWIRRGSVYLALTALFLITLVSAAQSGNAGGAHDDKSVYAELKKAPAKAAAKHNPLESDPEAAAAGAKLFEMHCAECHGATADGGKKGPSLRSEDVQQASPGALFWLLTNGVVRRGMPVWSKLPEPQRWQLVSFIRSLGRPAK